MSQTIVKHIPSHFKAVSTEKIFVAPPTAEVAAREGGPSIPSPLFQRVSEYTLPLPRRGTATRARAQQRVRFLHEAGCRDSTRHDDKAHVNTLFSLVLGPACNVRTAAWPFHERQRRGNCPNPSGHGDAFPLSSRQLAQKHGHAALNIAIKLVHKRPKDSRRSCRHLTRDEQMARCSPASTAAAGDERL